MTTVNLNYDAIEFVKKDGIEKIKQIVDLFPLSTMINIDGLGVSIPDLKQIVNAFELVERFGGIKEAKRVHYDEFLRDINWDNLQKSINLVEKCNES